MRFAKGLALNDSQIDLLAKYFADISKILAASTVVNFFVPSDINRPVTFSVLIGGSVFALFSLALSILLLRDKRSNII